MNWLLNYWLDILAVIWFFCCWLGYSKYSGLRARRRIRLQSAFQEQIDNWASALQAREMRVVDTSAIANLERTATFLGSSSLFILAGLLTLLGASESALGLIENIPFVQASQGPTMAFKGLLLVFIYINTFFTFTWCIRQYGLASIIVGATPPPNELASLSEDHPCKAQFSRVMGLAVYSFNLGLRSYYFSIAALAWFIHPVAFMSATIWITGVLYRREFHSKTLKALKDRPAG